MSWYQCFFPELVLSYCTFDWLRGHLKSLRLKSFNKSCLKSKFGKSGSAKLRGKAAYLIIVCWCPLSIRVGQFFRI